jgi:hypothetical protein
MVKSSRVKVKYNDGLKQRNYYRKTPYLVPGTTLDLKNFFLKVVPGIKCSNKIFQKFFRSKNKVFEPVLFFRSISWGLCTGTKCVKAVLFGFSTSTKGEFRIFEIKILFFTFSTGTVSEKYHFFAFGTGTKTQRNRRKKNSKNVFFGYLYRSK